MATSEIRAIRPTSFVSGAGATVNLPISKTGLDLTTVRSVIAAPSTGNQIIVLGVIFNNATAAAITMVLQEDTGGTPADIFPDINVAANATEVLFFPQGIPVTAAKDLGVKSSDADTGNSCTIFAYVDHAS